MIVGVAAAVVLGGAAVATDGASGGTTTGERSLEGSFSNSDADRGVPDPLENGVHSITVDPGETQQYDIELSAGDYLHTDVVFGEDADLDGLELVVLDPDGQQVSESAAGERHRAAVVQQAPEDGSYRVEVSYDGDDWLSGTMSVDHEPDPTVFEDSTELEDVELTDSDARAVDATHVYQFALSEGDAVNMSLYAEHASMFRVVPMDPEWDELAVVENETSSHVDIAAAETAGTYTVLVSTPRPPETYDLDVEIDSSAGSGEDTESDEVDDGTGTADDLSGFGSLAALLTIAAALVAVVHRGRVRP